MATCNKKWRVRACVRATCDNLVVEPGSRGRAKRFCDPMAGGKGGAENMAATTLMRVIHDCMSSRDLTGGEGREAQTKVC